MQVDFTLKILDFRKEGGRGLISREECVNVEVQSLDKYLSESKEWMLTFVVGEKGRQKWKIRIYLKSI